MKITVDEKRCEGYGHCEERASNLVQLNDDGELVILRSTVDDDEVDVARAAVRSCPVAALRLED